MIIHSERFTMSPISRRRNVAAGLADGIPANWSFLVDGPATVCQPTTAQSFGELLKPYRSTRQREGRESTARPMSQLSLDLRKMALVRSHAERILKRVLKTQKTTQPNNDQNP